MKRAAVGLALLAASAVGCSGTGQRFQDTDAGRVTCTGVRVGCRVAERFLCGGSGGDSGGDSGGAR
ncbi:MAG: hypothetical protein SangKO_031830 [Sandaracinaceae bacterium]